MLLLVCATCKHYKAVLLHIISKANFDHMVHMHTERDCAMRPLVQYPPADMNFQTARSSPRSDPSWRRAAMRASFPTGAVLGRCLVRFHRPRLSSKHPSDSVTETCNLLACFHAACCGNAEIGWCCCNAFCACSLKYENQLRICSLQE
jgi:hypothetical protein